MQMTVLKVAALLGLAAAQGAGISLEVGSVLPATYVPTENRRLYMTHPAQLRPYIEQDVGGITYVIAYDAKTGVITYISTTDKRFRSSDGLQVGGYVEVRKEQVLAYPGWEIRGPEDRNGWMPLIGFASEMTILVDGAEKKIVLKGYRLESQGAVKARIVAFVKGAN